MAAGSGAAQAQPATGAFQVLTSWDPTSSVNIGPVSYSTGAKEGKPHGQKVQQLRSAEGEEEGCEAADSGTLLQAASHFPEGPRRRPRRRPVTGRRGRKPKRRRPRRTTRRGGKRKPKKRRGRKRQRKGRVVRGAGKVTIVGVGGRPGRTISASTLLAFMSPVMMRKVVRSHLSRRKR